MNNFLPREGKSRQISIFCYLLATMALEYFFEPFFTTNRLGKGSGLGLNMIYGFIKQPGDRIEIESTTGEGAGIKTLLPRAMALVERGIEQAAQTIFATKGKRVLLVEEDAKVRNLAIQSLKNMGYRVAAAETAGSELHPEHRGFLGFFIPESKPTHTSTHT